MASASISPTNVPPVDDPAEPILRGYQNITDDQRAELWDIFHNSKDPNHLAQQLQTVLAPQDLKHSLWTAKHTGAPIERVSDALDQLESTDPKKLALAETYPTSFKAFVEAGKTAEKPAGEAVGKLEPAGKDKEAQPQNPLSQPPRRDGKPHLPAIPQGHYRVLARDGSVHDIPAENLEKARQIDPDLHVLNP